MTVRARLTLWYTTLLTVFVAGFALVVYVAVDRQLAGELDHAIELRAVEVAHDFASAWSAQSPGADEPLRVPTGSALADQPHFVQVVGRTGNILYSSPNLNRRLPISNETREILLDGQVTHDVLTLSNDRRLVLYGTPLMLDDDVFGVVLVAAPLWPLEQMLARLQFMLIIAVLGSIFVAGGVGWWLASAAMRPVDQITAVARAIGRSGDLSGRVPEPHRRDELGRLSTAFNELLARLDLAMQQQRRFLDDASHELRTPLTTIRASASALLRSGGNPTPGRCAARISAAMSCDARYSRPAGPTSSPLRWRGGPDPQLAGEQDPGGETDQKGDDTEEVRAIARESERMGRLVTDLLTLARADAGQELACRPLMLDAVLVDVYQQARLQASPVRLCIGDLTQIEIVGDADRLKQLLFNLVDNACRYTPPGGTVTLSLVEQDGMAALAVRDTGPGIAPDDLPRIFERFYRADRARSREAGGTGLGLAISRVIAEAHGGRIEVESTLGRGSTFTVLVPISTTAPSTDAMPGGSAVLTQL